MKYKHNYIYQVDLTDDNENASQSKPSQVKEEG